MATIGKKSVNIDLICEQGATFNEVLTFYANDILVDWTGYTAKMQIKTVKNFDEPAILTLTTENGGIVLGGTAGTIQLYISGNATNTLNSNLYYYDLKVYSGIYEYRKLEGSFQITAGVTSE